MSTAPQKYLGMRHATQAVRKLHAIRKEREQ